MDLILTYIPYFVEFLQKSYTHFQTANIAILLRNFSYKSQYQKERLSSDCFVYIHWRHDLLPHLYITFMHQSLHAWDPCHEEA